MPGKRLTKQDLATLAPVFGFAGDVNGFAQFVAEQQGKADSREAIENARVRVVQI